MFENKAPTEQVEQAQASVKNLIANHYKKIEELKEQSKALAGMIDEELENDSEYQELVDQAKSLSEEKSDKRAELIEQNSRLKEKHEKLKEMKRELKDSRKALGSFCAEHYRETRQLTFADHLGNDHSFEFGVAYK